MALLRSLRPLARSFATAPPPTLTLEHLLKVDPQLASVAPKVATYGRPAADAAVERARAALAGRKHAVQVVATPAEALAALKALIPAGATVMSTSSISLAQIGYLDYAMQAPALPYTNLNAAIFAERDPAKQAALRRHAAAADVVLSSPVAVTEAGEIFIVDATGTRVSPVLAGGRVVFVVGANKVVPTLADATRRLNDYVYPLESARVRAAYNLPKEAASTIANAVTVNVNTGGAQRSHVIIVKTALGY